MKKNFRFMAMAAVAMAAGVFTGCSSEDDFLAAYRAQLDLYALAISKRFAPKPVTYKGIYSLELGKLIEVK